MNQGQLSHNDAVVSNPVVMSHQNQTHASHAAMDSHSRFADRIAFYLAQADSCGVLANKWNRRHWQGRAATDEACYQAIAWEILSG